MNDDVMVAKLHKDHPGIFWAGDVYEGWCTACGQPCASGEDGSWWHRYATHIVACPGRSGAIPMAKFIPVDISCDWGTDTGLCDEPSVGIRFTDTIGWLPVCQLHSVEPVGEAEVHSDQRETP